MHSTRVARSESIAPGGGRDVAGEWSIADLGGDRDLPGLEPEWRRIHRTAPFARAHNGFDAIAALANHPAPGHRDSRYLGVREGSVLRAIVPLELRVDRALGIPGTVAGFPWNDEWPLGDLVADSPQAARKAVELSIGWLRTGPWHAHVMVVGPLPADELVWAGIGDSGRPATVYGQGGWNYIDCSGSLDDYMRALHKNFRGNLRKARNKLAALDHEYVVAETPEDVAREFSVFLELEASGWKGRAGTALTQHAWKVDWYRDWLARMSARGCVQVNALYVEGRCVASQLCAITGTTYEVGKIAYDEGHARLAPGQLLMERTLQRCFGDPGLATVDLMSDTPWHYDWGVARRPFSMGRVAVDAVGALTVPLLRFRFGALRRIARGRKQR